MPRPAEDYSGKILVKTNVGDYNMPYVRITYYKIKCPFCRRYIRAGYYRQHLNKSHHVEIQYYDFVQTSEV
jgi:hypothetical protein